MSGINRTTVVDNHPPLDHNVTQATKVLDVLIDEKSLKLQKDGHV